MVVQFDVTYAPVPDGNGPLTRPFVIAPIYGVFFALPLYIVTFMVWPIVGGVIPAWDWHHLQASLGLSENAFGARVYFFLVALCWMAAAYFLIAEARRRVPVYGLTMGELSALLTGLRRRLRSKTRLAGVFPWLNLAAAFAVWWVAAQSGWWGIFEGPANFAFAAVAALIMAVLLVNWLRLVSHGATARRFFASLGLDVAAAFAAVATFFVVAIIFAIIVLLFAGRGDGGDGAVGLGVVGGMGLGAFAGYAVLKRVEARVANASAKLRAATAHDKLRQDRRKPVLFLRSFKDDNAEANKYDKEGKDDRDFERLENIIANVAHGYGPLIAVGEPGKIPKSGAARAYYDGDDWREAVTTWMDQALMIIMVAGYTEGVRWELESAIARGHARKLVLIFPRDRAFDARWAWVRALLGERAFGPAMDQARRDGAILIATDSSDNLNVMTSRRALGQDYRAALALAVYGKFVRTG